MAELLVLGAVAALGMLKLNEREYEEEPETCLERRPEPVRPPRSAEHLFGKGQQVSYGRLDAYPGAHMAPSNYQAAQNDFARRADVMTAHQIPRGDNFHPATGGVVKGYVPGLKQTNEHFQRKERCGSPFVPFFKKSANAYNDKLSQSRLELFSGSDPVTVNFSKSNNAGVPADVGPIWDPQPDREPAKPIHQMRDRVAPSALQTGVNPVEQQWVGPGVGIDPNQISGGDGFQPMMRILPDNVNAYKMNSLESRIIPGANRIANPTTGATGVAVNKPKLLVQRASQKGYAAKPQAPAPYADNMHALKQTMRQNAGTNQARDHMAPVLEAPGTRLDISARQPRSRNTNTEAAYRSGREAPQNSAMEYQNVPGGYALERVTLRGDRQGREAGEHAFGQLSYANGTAAYSGIGHQQRTTGRSLDCSYDSSRQGVGQDATAGGMGQAMMQRGNEGNGAYRSQRGMGESETHFNPAGSRIGGGSVPLDASHVRPTNRTADSERSYCYSGAAPSAEGFGSMVRSQQEVRTPIVRRSETDRMAGGAHNRSVLNAAQMGEGTKSRSDSDARAIRVRAPMSSTQDCNRVACGGAELAKLTEVTQTKMLGEVESSRARDLAIAQNQLADNPYHQSIACAFGQSSS
jgi:hypothetical protein